MIHRLVDRRIREKTDMIHRLVYRKKEKKRAMYIHWWKCTYTVC